MLGQVFLGWTSTKQGLVCLAQGHNKVPPVMLEPATLWLSQALYHWATALSWDFGIHMFDPPLNTHAGPYPARLEA